MYRTLTKIAEKVFTQAQIFKYGFNLSPMYRRSTGRITDVSEDLMVVKVRIPISWKNKNYVGSIFGGSLFSATDPIYMIQLIHILGDDYVVWDKSAEIKFKRPVRTHAFVEFTFTDDEIEKIKHNVATEKEISLVKDLKITDGKETLYCELKKVIYIADKDFYREKRNKKKLKKLPL